MAEPIAPPNLDGIAPGQTFPLEIVRSGFAVDGRGFTREFISQLCENTCLMIVGAGAQVAAQRGHNLGGLIEEPKDDVPLEGSATGFRLAPSSEDPNEIALCADVRLWGSLLMDFQQGKFPKRSIKYSPSGTLPDGRLVGAYVEHVAFYGAVPVAMPGLGDAAYAASGGIIRRVFNGLKAYFGGGSKAEALAALSDETEPTKEAAMAAPAAAKNPMLEACESMMAGLQSLMGMLAEGGTPAPAIEEPKPDDEMPPMDESYSAAKPAANTPSEGADKALALENEVNALRRRAAEASYAKFAAEGRAGKDEAAKALFMRLVAKAGLDEADRHYAAITPITPPRLELRDDGNDPDAATNRSLALNDARRAGLPADLIKRLEAQAGVPAKTA